MARIPMTSGFTLCPEGVHVFRIYDVMYDEKWGKLEVKMVNAQGITHTERFSLKDQNDEPNEGALNAFSYFAKTALQNLILARGMTLTRMIWLTTTSAPRLFIRSSHPAKTPPRPSRSPTLATSPLRMVLRPLPPLLR